MLLDRLLLLALILSSITVHGAFEVAASAATPVASPVAQAEGRLDLAAMALSEEDLPSEFRQRFFDNEGYTPADRIASIQFADSVSHEEIMATGITWFYSSTFQTDDNLHLIYVYLNEFATEADVEKGFAFFEDEQRFAVEGSESRDQPGPEAGGAPKETTVITYTDPTSASNNQHVLDATFRIGRVLAGVAAVSFGAASPPDPALVESLAARLAERIETVQAGEAPPGLDLTLPERMLPLFATWPWPGNSLEGHKSAEDFLGDLGPAAQFASDFENGYAVFASAGSANGGKVHDPPYIDIAVARFASADAALGVLDAAESFLRRHDGAAATREVIPSPQVTGADAIRAFRVDRPNISDPDSLHLVGTEIVLVQGNMLAAISVLVDADDLSATPEQADAIAIDLAGQQSECLQDSRGCGPVQIPEILTSVVTPS